MVDTTAMESAEWNSLNDRQKEQAQAVSNLATKFGLFDQTSGANGAHYAPAAKNPFQAEGLMCQNCIFFDETNNQCQVVAGKIEPKAVCKLWIIPEITSKAQLAGMTPDQVMAAKNAGRLNGLLGKN
jgi:hypothetical protein